MKIIGEFIRIVIGLILYAVDPKFRAMVNAKLRGANENVDSGEHIHYVLRKEQVSDGNE